MRLGLSIIDQPDLTLTSDSSADLGPGTLGIQTGTGAIEQITSSYLNNPSPAPLLVDTSSFQNNPSLSVPVAYCSWWDALVGNLDSNGVPCSFARYETQGSSPPASTGVPWYVWAIGGGLVLVLLLRR